MTQAPADGAALWSEALLAAGLLALDGPGLGGVLLRSRAGPVRERWLAELRALSGSQPMPRLPAHADPDRLCGGLDLAATLSAGRPVGERGLLSQADGGVLLVAMAERLGAGTAAAIGAVMDTGRLEAAVVREMAPERPIRFAVVALDESATSDEGTPAGLADRLALHADLDAVSVRDLQPMPWDAGDLERARALLPQVRADADVIEVLCAAAQALGVDSLRTPWFALRTARALAALDGREQVCEQDVAAAARLVLAPRATRLPAAEQNAPEADESPEDNPDPPRDSDVDDDVPEPEPDAAEDTDRGPDSNADDKDEPPPGLDESPLDRILEAVRARVPAGLLEASLEAREGRVSQGSAGKSGAMRQAGVRGRPAGVRRGQPGPNARLNLVETLRAAAPWQGLREQGAGDGGARVRVRRDDFRVTRFKMRRETITVFLVDASGSAALHRLAEAKGAVELLLADCYVRRDQVALVSFRGVDAELLLPPTRSLVQAKRRLAELPGGGGTPLAAGLNCVLELSHGIVRRGATPVIVALTDGRANISADGKPGREQAHLDALAAARRLRAAGLTTLLIDTSPRPRPLGEELAVAMGARYLPLPHADAVHLSAAVRAQTRAA